MIECVRKSREAEKQEKTYFKKNQITRVKLRMMRIVALIIMMVLAMVLLLLLLMMRLIYQHQNGIVHSIITKW